MYNLWSDTEPFPSFENFRKIDGIKHTRVHIAVEGDYQFLLGAAVAKHNGILYSSWANSWRYENDDNTVLAEKRSYDGGKTWNDYKIISTKESKAGRSHGVYFPYGGKLYIFCPRANFDNNTYPDLKTEGYILEEDGTYRNLGIVLDKSFWPMCEPIVLDDGKILMAGLETSEGIAAVAICDGSDLTKWEMKTVPNPNGYKYWGESTAIKCDDRLVLLSRGGDDVKKVLVSESFDGGESWTGLEESNFPATISKMYGGRLPNGEKYLIFSVLGRGYRDTLALAVGEDKFDRIYLIRDGFDCPPRFWMNNEWCYPYATLDKEQNKLYIVYAENKENCEFAEIPLQSIEK